MDLSYDNDNDDNNGNNSDDSERQIDGYTNISPRKTNTITNTSRNTSAMTIPKSDSSDADLSSLNATPRLSSVSLLHIPDRL